MKFAVTLEEVVRHTTVVEADNAEQAEAKADELLLAGHMDRFQTEVTNREFVGTEVAA